MKKIVAILLALSMIFVFAACGSKPADDGNKGGADALGILNTIWNSYGEDEKFPVAGGDNSEENMTTAGPGKFAITDAAVLDSAFGIPAAAVEKIDDAASLMHMMNANNLTCAVFHVAKSGDVKAVVDAIKDNMAQRQWMCGIPDMLLIVTIDDCVLSAFGFEDNINTLKTKTLAAYTGAEIVVEQAITE